MSVGIETLGRTSYLGRLPPCEAAFVVSLELASKPVGDVALLDVDVDDRAEEPSSRSVVIEEVIE